MPASSTSRKTILTVTVALAIVAVIVIYALFDPSQLPFPRCPLLTVTGYRCPGCGSQRALHQLLHLHFSTAWRYNPAVFFGLVLIPLYACAEWWPRRFARLHRVLLSKAFLGSLLAAILAWWIGRNLVGL